VRLTEAWSAGAWSGVVVEVCGEVVGDCVEVVEYCDVVV
jgi:hypothetical protein